MPPREIYCYQCAMTLRVSAPLRGDRLICSDCKRPFWTSCKKNYVIVGIDPDKLDAWGESTNGVGV